MKKTVLTFIFTLCITIMLAQKRKDGAVELIPNVGYSSYFLNGEDVENIKSIEAFRTGISGDYYFNDRWSLRTGMIYESMGATQAGVDLLLNYLTVPLNINWHFGSTRKWNLNFGVSPSFLLDGKVDRTNVTRDFESFQLGISYGIGYKLKISNAFSILIDSQGFLGLSNIVKDGSDLKRSNVGSSLNIGGVFNF